MKVVLLSLVAVFAVSAVASSSASAALKDRYYEQPSEKELGTEKIEGKVGVAYFQSTLAGQKILIESPESSNTLTEAEIYPGGKSAGRIIYTKPVLYTIKEGKKENTSATCEIAKIEFSFKDKLIEQTKGGVVGDEFEPASGTSFVKIVITSVTGKTCLLASTIEVVGTYIASLGAQAEEDRTEHEIVFTEAGSNVTYATKGPAAYTNVVSGLKRTNRKEWYVD